MITTEMALDWHNLKEEYQNGNIKTYFSDLYHGIDSHQEAVRVSDAILTCRCVDSADIVNCSLSDISFQISLLRAFFQTVPKNVVSHLTLPSDLITWLSDAIFQFEVVMPNSYSLVGGILVVFASILKDFEAIPIEDVEKIGKCVNIALRQSVDLFSEFVLSQDMANPKFSQAAIILHTSVEILMAIREPSIRLFEILSKSFVMSVKMLRITSQIVVTQCFIDGTKLFGILAEYFITISSSSSGKSEVFKSISKNLSEEFHENDVIEYFSHVIVGINKFSTLHDSYLLAFHAMMDIVRFGKKNFWPAFHSTENLVQTLVVLLISSLQELSSQNIMSVKRIELLLGCIQSIFQVDSLGIPSGTDVPMAAQEGQIDLLVTCFCDLQHRLKESMKQLRGTNQLYDRKYTPEEIEDYRQTCGEIRKSTIQALESMWYSCPSWIPNNFDAFWNISITVLSTPLLFRVAYVSWKNQFSWLTVASTATTTTTSGLHSFLAPPGLEKELSEMNYSDQILPILRILRYVREAVKNLSRYSLAAALDIIQALQSLCQANCLELLYDPCQFLAPNSVSPSIFECLLQALDCCPRLPASARLSSQSKKRELLGKANKNANGSYNDDAGDGDDDEPHLIQWKIQLSSLMESFIHLWKRMGQFFAGLPLLGSWQSETTVNSTSSSVGSTNLSPMLNSNGSSGFSLSDVALLHFYFPCDDQDSSTLMRSSLLSENCQSLMIHWWKPWIKRLGDQRWLLHGLLGHGEVGEGLPKGLGAASKRGQTRWKQGLQAFGTLDGEWLMALLLADTQQWNALWDWIFHWKVATASAMSLDKPCSIIPTTPPTVESMTTSLLGQMTSWNTPNKNVMEWWWTEYQQDCLSRFPMMIAITKRNPEYLDDEEEIGMELMSLSWMTIMMAWNMNYPQNGDYLEATIKTLCTLAVSRSASASLVSTASVEALELLNHAVSILRGGSSSSSSSDGKSSLFDEQSRLQLPQQQLQIQDKKKKNTIRFACLLEAFPTRADQLLEL